MKKELETKVFALGGLGEVGKNMYCVMHNDEIIIVDSGVMFPEEELLGIDYVIPDYSYLKQNEEKIKALLITHGHEDHIGGITFLLQRVNIPKIYAPYQAKELIDKKLLEKNIKKKIIVYNEDTKIKTKHFSIEFFRTTHSIPDSHGISITTPNGVIVMTGDFKFDLTPIGPVADIHKMARIGSNKVRLLMSDSTNALVEGTSLSESIVDENLNEIFATNKGSRIIIATFASNVHRIQQIVNSAIKYNRKIAVCGRSMINMIETARKFDYIKVPDNVFIDIDMIKNYTDEQLVIITTGSQGETMSALTRMASGEHKKVVITPNDLVIISANPIPGNEKLVGKVIDDLMKIGAEVVYSSLEDVHVSGHACQEEQKLIISLVRPKFFLPVHGEYRQLRAHAETARKVGIEPRNIFMLENGRTLELNEKEAKLTNSVPSGKILVDGLGVGDVGNIVLRDRQHLSQDGLIVIVMTMDSSTGEIVSGPDVVSRGFVYVRESENLMEDVKRVIREEVKKCEEKRIRDWSTIKSALKDNLRDYIFQKTKRNPMILPVIMEI